MSKILLMNKFDGERKFTSLTDAPSSYAGQGNKLVGVNSGASGLEFKTPPSVIDTYLGLTDTPDTYAGYAGQGVKVKADQSGLTFGMQQPRYDRTTPGGELNTTVPITLGTDTVWKTIFRLDLSSPLAIGDILSVDTKCEVRIDTVINAELAFSLWVSNSSTPNDSTDIEVDGLYIAQTTGHNVDNPGKHYADPAICGTIKLPVAYATPRIFLRVRSRSTDAGSGTHTATIMTGYGFISAIVFPLTGA